VRSTPESGSACALDRFDPLGGGVWACAAGGETVGDGGRER